MNHIGINLSEVGPIDCDTNAMCLDRDGGYDCECSTGYSVNGTYCEGIYSTARYTACACERGVNLFYVYTLYMSPVEHEYSRPGAIFVKKEKLLAYTHVLY